VIETSLAGITNVFPEVLSTTV
jgi:hypothetical protein